LRKYIKRIVVLCILIIVYILIRAVCDKVEKKFSQPRDVYFELPFPDNIIEKYEIKDKEVVEKVILAGFFSDWNPEDEFFEMAQVESNQWHYSMRFEPGDNQYKFVVYLKGRDYPIWSEDKHAKIQVPDSFAGVNSVIRIQTTRNLVFIINILFLGAIAIIIFYSILEPLIEKILVKKIKLKYKLAFSVLIIGLVSNIFFIAYNYLEQRRFIELGFKDSINIVHNFLLSRGVDFQNISDENNAYRAERELRNLLKRSMARIERTKFSNIQIAYTDIVIFDSNFNLISLGTTDNGINIHTDSFKRYGFSSVEEYARYGLFGNVIKKVSRENPEYRGITPGKTHNDYMQHHSRKILIDRFFLGSNCFIAPIIHQHKLVGYYGVAYTVELFGEEFRRVLVFNLYLIITTAILFAFLLANVGEIITKRLRILIDWTQAIIRGDFNVEKTIRTNDEIESLANNFDLMRRSLGSNMSNLRLMNLASASLPTITNIDDLYNVFLTFITANFGFGYNRAAIFIKEWDFLLGKYAVGLLDIDEATERFGNIDNYINLKMDAKSFMQNYKKYFEQIETRFLRAVRQISVHEEAPCVFWEVLDKNRVLSVNSNSGSLSDIDREIIKELNLDTFTLLPIFKGDDKIGILLVDNRFKTKNITEENVNQLQILLNHFAVNLQNAYMINNLEQKVWERAAELKEERNKLKERNQIIEAQLHIMQTELVMANQLQQQFIPQKSPSDKIYAFYKPMDMVGGDFYDFIGFDDPDKIGIFVSDVSGHGVPAAFITSMIKSFILRGGKHLENPAGFLTYLNESLYRRTNENFITAFYCIIDFKTGIIRYANAGHNYPYIIVDNKITQLSLKQHSPPLAIVSNNYLENKKRMFVNGKKTLKPNSRLILYTDGLTEAVNINEQKIDFETALLNEIFLDAKGLPSNDFVDMVFSRLVDFRGSEKFDDDVCIICIDI